LLQFIVCLFSNGAKISGNCPFPEDIYRVWQKSGSLEFFTVFSATVLHFILKF